MAISLYKSLLPFLLLSFFIFSCLTLFSQNFQNEQLFKKAQTAVDEEEFSKALVLFRQLDSLEPKNPYYNFFLGVCYVNTKSDYAKGIQSLQFSMTNLDRSEHFLLLNAYFNLGKVYHLSNRFDDAIDVYQKILEEKIPNTLTEKATREIEVCSNAKKIIQHPVKVTIKNLGKDINSNYSDYAPLITADESILMFSSKRIGCIGGAIDEDEQYVEDIYVSHKDISGLWSLPQNIGSPINTKDYDATVALSVDGEQLFLYKGCKSGIFISTKDGTNWSEPKKLNKNINSGNSETSASLSSDGKTLYFISSREGGYGGKDIYKSELQENGEWGTAVNLGSTVNTPYDEESPFIHPDNKTLYFSSQGHNTMGGFDIFKTELKRGEWSEPQNMGYPINSTADEIHFILSAKGTTGYYASNRPDGYGREDIYAATFPQVNIPLTMVRGTIITEGKKKQNVKIKIIDKETNEQVKHIYIPNAETGKYLMIFPPGKNYQMLVDAEGYLPFVFDIYIPNQTYFYSLYQTIYLKPITPFNAVIGQGVSIENSFFDAGDTLKNEETERKNDSLLLSLIDKIIETTDSSQLATVENIQLEEKNYTPLTSLIEKIIDYTDSTALENLERITQQGFFEKAEENIYFYGDKKKNLEPFVVGKDTIYIIPPSVSLAGKDNDSSEKNIDITEKVDEIRFRTVLNKSIPFDFAVSDFPKQFSDTLLKIASMLRKFPNLKVEIVGHTDNIGSERLNQKLSEQRAESIADFLNRNGVEKDRVTSIGKGKSQPMQSNATEDGRKANRRVELRITETIIKQKIVH